MTQSSRRTSSVKQKHSTRSNSTMTRFLLLLAFLTSATFAFQLRDDSKVIHINRSEKNRSLEPELTYAKPVTSLEFWDKVKKRPKGRNFNLGRLMKKIGNDFDPSWMSVDQPAREPQSRKQALEDTDQLAELMEQVARLDIDDDIRELLGPDQREHEPTIQRAVGAFQQWLVRKSSCPVRFEWADLGEYFWPRYIRQGRCEGEGAEGRGSLSCSWPRGMSCEAAEAKIHQILRWHCRIKHNTHPLGRSVRQNLKKSYRCRWIKVPYPVTSSCRCK